VIVFGAHIQRVDWPFVPGTWLDLLYNNTFLRARMAEMTAVQLTALVLSTINPASAAPHIFDVA
jgi:hypothetical protein